MILSRPCGTCLAWNVHPALRAGLGSAVPSGLVSRQERSDMETAWNLRWVVALHHSDERALKGSKDDTDYLAGTFRV